MGHLSSHPGPRPQDNRQTIKEEANKQKTDQSGSSIEIEADGSEAVGDDGDQHDQHLDGARPVREVGPVVFERVQLLPQVLVAGHHRLAQRPTARKQTKQKKPTVSLFVLTPIKLGCNRRVFR